MFPTPLTSASTVVRKVQINDAYDIGRWWFRGIDGIRETTWPGVYNRSRIVGRFDYFQLPDWDCYAISGKTVTFMMPKEPWNHLEFSGGAFGKMDLLTPDATEDAVRRAGLDGKMLPAKTLFDRPSGQETTFHDFATPVTGGQAALHQRGAGDADWRVLRVLRASGQAAGGDCAAQVPAGGECIAGGQPERDAADQLHSWALSGG